MQYYFSKSMYGYLTNKTGLNQQRAVTLKRSPQQNRLQQVGGKVVKALCGLLFRPLLDLEILSPERAGEPFDVYKRVNWNIHRSGNRAVVKGEANRLLDRYLKTTWTVFPSPRIFASWFLYTLQQQREISGALCQQPARHILTVSSYLDFYDRRASSLW